MKKKKIYMKDIADELGLSINSISLALNDRPGISSDTRQKIIQTAQQLGYIFDYTQPSSEIKNICLLLNERYIVNSSFYSKIVYSIEAEAKKNNIDIIVNFFSNSKNEDISCIRNKSVSGLLIGGTLSDEYLKDIAGYNIPTVLIDHTPLFRPFDCVITQNMAGCFNAAQYMFHMGHHKIGFFGDINMSMSFKNRWLGFNECLRENRPDHYLRDLQLYSITDSISGLVMDKNFPALVPYLNRLEELPTAFVCCNDETAIALYQALSLMNLKVPDDISIIGFDDIDACCFVTPALTTMSVNRELMGQVAFNRLLEQLSRPDPLPVQHIALPVSFIERGSVLNLN